MTQTAEELVENLTVEKLIELIEADIASGPCTGDCIHLKFKRKFSKQLLELDKHSMVMLMQGLIQYPSASFVSGFILALKYCEMVELETLMKLDSAAGGEGT